MRKFLPAPYDLLACIWAVVAYVILLKLPIYYPILETMKQAMKSYLSFVLLAFGTLVISSLAKRKLGKNSSSSGRSSLEELKRQNSITWLEYMRIPLAIFVTLVFHFLLKSSIFLINPRIWDVELQNLDRILHFGFSPTLFLLELFKSEYFYRGIDIFYALIYGALVLLYPPIFVGIGSRYLVRSFTTAFLLIFIIGWAGYVLFPSWGPVFREPQEFEASLQYMPRTVKIQSQLYKETVSLVRNPQAPRIIIYGGIAAFPSLHVALLTLFALVSRSISITWFKINLLFVVFMVIGSVVTGYHYLVDSYAGLLLGWGAYYLAKLWVSKWDREDTEDANESSKGIASVEKHQLPKPPEVEEPPPNT